MPPCPSSRSTRYLPASTVPGAIGSVSTRTAKGYLEPGVKSPSSAARVLTHDDGALAVDEHLNARVFVRANDVASFGAEDDAAGVDIEGVRLAIIRGRGLEKGVFARAVTEDVIDRDLVELELLAVGDGRDGEIAGEHGARRNVFGDS